MMMVSGKPCAKKAEFTAHRERATKLFSERLD